MHSVCVGTANTLTYPQGGHLWVFLNWALGFRSLGLDVVWLDMVGPNSDPSIIAAQLAELRARISPWGFGDRIALIDVDGNSLTGDLDRTVLGSDDAAACDLLFDLRYNLPLSFVKKFRHSALLNIDPGLLEFALMGGGYNLAPHDRYFTIGRLPYRASLDTGHPWISISPCVHLPSWAEAPVAAHAPFSTLAHWSGALMTDEDGNLYPNDKRAAFEPYLNLPAHNTVPMELAINIWDMGEEKTRLEQLGWRITDAHVVAGTPADFQHYIQQSFAEFSCAKPSYVRMRTSWISDRTLCYLASGRPAVVEWTGNIAELGSDGGLLRFKTPDEARASLLDVVDRYAYHSKQARRLAEEQYSSHNIVSHVLNLL
jgi:hypothetical protein